MSEVNGLRAISRQLNDHITKPGHALFKHACRMGLDGVVSMSVRR